MKIDAINKVIQLKSEKALIEIISHLEQLNIANDNTINLSANYDVIKKEFGNVLQKLAQ